MRFETLASRPSLRDPTPNYQLGVAFSTLFENIFEKLTFNDFLMDFSVFY